MENNITPRYMIQEPAIDDAAIDLNSLSDGLAILRAIYDQHKRKLDHADNEVIVAKKIFADATDSYQKATALRNKLYDREKDLVYLIKNVEKEIKLIKEGQ